MAFSLQALRDMFRRRARQERARNSKRHRWLRCETLERRRVMANNLGVITGEVFIDTTGDGLTAGEQVPGAMMEVYRDVNGNGTLEAGGADGPAVQMTNTDGSGIYEFNGLTAGRYLVRQLASVPLGLNEQVSDPIEISATEAMGIPGIEIDTFNTTTQAVSASGGGFDESSVTPAPDALGNERDMFAQVTSVGGQLDLQANTLAVPGVLAAGGLGAAMGPRVVTWDGLDNNGAERAYGLDDVDLTSQGISTAIQLLIGASESGGLATMRVYTTADRFSTALVNIPQTPTGGPTGEVILDFDQAFADAGVSGGANFGNVRAIEFELDSMIIDVDMQMDFVGAIGPTVFMADFDNFEPIDLQLSKTVNINEPDLNQNVTFTITLEHVDAEQDGVAATNVQVTDQLPAGLTYVGDNPSQGDYDPVTGVWTVGTVPANGSATLMITATVATPGPKTNSAQVTAADQFDIDSTPNNNLPAEDDQDSVVVEPAVVDLQLTKTIDDSTPNVGQNVLFTIVVANVDADTTATGVRVRDQLPSGMTLINHVASQGAYNTTTGIWNVGTLAAGGGDATLTLTASVDTQGARTNTAEVIDADQADIDSTPDNNLPNEDDQDSADLNTPQIDLALTKTVSNATPSLNDNVQFTITLNNTGPDAATGVSVLDQLPDGMTFVASAPSQGAYNPTSGIWTVGSLGATGGATLQITASVDTLGAKTNIAQVFAANEFDVDSTPDNDVPAEDDQDDAVLEPIVIDLELTKTVDNSTANVGENVTFTITVENVSTNDATGVAVSDSLPAGLTFVSADADTGSYSNTNGIWTVGVLAAGDSATLDIVARVATSGTKINVAQVSGANEFDVDSTPGNGVLAEDDQDEAPVTPPVIDLQLVKSVGDATPALNDDVVFTIQLSNQGPDNATGVEVTDVLPAGLTLLASNPSQGDYNETTGVWDVGTLNNGANATLTLTANVDTGGVKTNVARVTAADQFDVDSTPGNDVLSEDDQDDAQITTDVNSSLSGFVYVDTNDNGIKDPGEPGIFGVTVTLTKTAGDPGSGVGETRSVLTDRAGRYLFDDLSAGVYEIRETQPPGFRDGQDNAEDGLEGDPDGITTQNDVFQDVDLLEGVNGIDFNFGELANMLSKRRFLASS